MCGFVGVINFNNNTLEECILRGMTDSISHRGPDDDGYFQNIDVSFGFRRLSIIDIDNCTDGHYNALLYGIDNERYVLNSFHVTSEELIRRVKKVTNWDGSPIYIPKGLLKSAGPLFDLVSALSSGESIICRESVRVLTHGHVYDGSKAQSELKIDYIDVDSFIHKIISWLISQDLLKLAITNKD